MRPRRSLRHWLVLALLLTPVAAALAGTPSVATRPEVLGPKRPPHGRECTVPADNSLVTGSRTAAYVQVCGQVAPGYPTTLIIADVRASGVSRTSYQLSAIRPFLLAMDDTRLTWLQMQPGTSRIGDRVRLVSFEPRSKRLATLDEVRTPFAGSVLSVSRGDRCWLARMRGGLAASGRTGLLLVNDGHLHMIDSVDGEDAVLWDDPSGGFILTQWPQQAQRAIDCDGRSVAVAPAAASLLTGRRHMLDRYWSLPPARAVAVDPLGDSADKHARLMQAQVDSAGRVKYVGKNDFPRIHAVASSSDGEQIAVVTEQTVELIGPERARRSLDISDATGWNTQIQFLKDRPVLIVLDDSRMTAVDMEH